MEQYKDQNIYCTRCRTRVIEGTLVYHMEQNKTIYRLCGGCWMNWWLWICPLLYNTKFTEKQLNDMLKGYCYP